jgi:hypothetical protein
MTMAKVFQYISKMKLPGGVVGKTSKVMIYLVVAMAAIVWAVQKEWIAALALVLMSAIVLIGLRWMISFADRHPQAALYEGGEFLRHEQLIYSSKNERVIIASADDNIRPHPVEISAEDRLCLAQADDSCDSTAGTPSNRTEGNNG